MPTLRSNDAIHALEHTDVHGEPNAVAIIDPRGHHFHIMNSAHVPVVCLDILCARLLRDGNRSNACAPLMAAHAREVTLPYPHWRLTLQCAPMTIFRQARAAEIRVSCRMHQLTYESCPARAVCPITLLLLLLHPLLLPG